MSNECPLCGNNKNIDSLFCDNCKNKIEKEYEVDIPSDNSDTSGERDEVLKSELKNSEIEPTFSKDPVLEGDNNNSTASKPKKNKKSGVVTILLVILFSFGAFFIYNQTIRKSNLERTRWDAALKANNVSAYLDYMQNFPNGKHYSLAEQSILTLKKDEAKMWERLHISENSAELNDFMVQFPESPYIPLVKRRLDSLIWSAGLKDNTAESYKRYIELSKSGEISGDYLNLAEKRFQLLNQTFPVNQTELDSLRTTVDGFFNALSVVDADELEKYLAPKVYRFFKMGGDTREKIVGDLLISGSKTQSPTITFTPNINSLVYEKTLTEHFKVNLPIQKTYPDENNNTITIGGYIIQMELDNNYQILTISEIDPES